MNNVFDKITVVIPSAHKAEDKQSLLSEMSEKAGLPLDIVFVGENAEGLTTIFQRELENSSNDIVVFVHDDVHFISKDWAKTLANIFQKYSNYGIIGVAGTKYYGVNNEIAWWKYTPQCGMIFHGNEEKNFFSIFGDYNLKEEVSEVVVIDGVFIACVKSRLQQGFDTNLKGYHFYDIDFCLNNRDSKQCKIGVTDRITLMHESTGNPNEQWAENGKIVYEKHKDKFPIRVIEMNGKRFKR